MSTKRHVILGYPNSGKTTYLAALWHVIDAGVANTSLVLEKLTGDTAYLNEIKETWIKCRQVPRTRLNSDEMVEMLVRDTKAQQKIVLSLPDFSGETFQSIYADRECDEQFAEKFEDVEGILFFINADRANDMMSVLDHAFEEESADSKGNDDPPLEDFDLRKVPEQTRVVEMLQLLQGTPFYPRRRRVVLAISAWDVVLQDGISPREWVAREMPLLDQFLKNNEANFDLRFCGISAQGGEFNEQTRVELLKKTPAERVICDWEGSSGPDITQPLTWLGGDGV